VKMEYQRVILSGKIAVHEKGSWLMAGRASLFFFVFEAMHDRGVSSVFCDGEIGIVCRILAE